MFLGDPITNSGGQLYVSRVDFERCLTPMLRPGHGVTVRPSPKIVVLDAGHGGNDPGKSNPKLGVNEKTFALDVALRTGRLLVAGGHRVVLTREDDSFVSLPQRAVIAGVARAEVFVSIHFNALADDRKTSGVEVYSFAPRFQRSSNAWSPAVPNDTEDYASPGNRFDHWNTVLAHAIHRRFVVDLKTPDRGKKLMHLAVLRRCSVRAFWWSVASDEQHRGPQDRDPGIPPVLAVTLAAIRDYATLDGLRLQPALHRPRLMRAGKPTPAAAADRNRRNAWMYLSFLFS